jgi:hypothetical protein
MVLLQLMDPWGRGIGIGLVFCIRGSGFAFGMQIHIGGRKKNVVKVLQFLIIKSLDPDPQCGSTVLEGTDTFYM